MNQDDYDDRWISANKYAVTSTECFGYMHFCIVIINVADKLLLLLQCPVITLN